MAFPRGFMLSDYPLTAIIPIPPEENCVAAYGDEPESGTPAAL